jgi:hypothetical protein
VSNHSWTALGLRHDTSYSRRVKKRCLPAALALALAFGHPVRAEGVRATTQPLVILIEEGREDAEDAAFFSSVRALAGEIGIGVSTLEVPSFKAVRDTLLSEAQQTTKLFLVAWILRDTGIREMYLFDPSKNELRMRTASMGAADNTEAVALAAQAAAGDAHAQTRLVERLHRRVQASPCPSWEVPRRGRRYPGRLDGDPQVRRLVPR